MKGLAPPVAALCWAVALGAFLLPVSNPDLFWHLSAARRIVETGSLPRADWLSHTMAGAPWSDFEWLSQLIFYGALKAAGLWGLVALKASLFAAAAASLWSALGLYGVGPAGRGLAVAAWAVALSPSNDLRPENFSMLLFTLQWRALESRRLRALADGGGGWELSPASSAAAAGLYALWANLHPGFLYGLLLLAIYAAAEGCRRRSLGLLRLPLLCCLSTLLNPYGLGLYRVIVEHLRHLAELQRYILEWQEPSVMSLWLAPFWLLFTACFLAVLVRYLQDRAVPAEHLAAISLYALSAASHTRTAMYFTLVAAPVAACHLKGMDWGRWGRARGALMALAVLAHAAFFSVKMVPELVLRRPFLPRFIPDQVTRYLASERPVLGGKRMLNPWAWGGYLGWQLHPDYRVFVDGRYIFHGLLKPMQQALETPERYREFLDRYGIELVVQERVPQLMEMRIELSDGRRFPILRPVYLLYLPRQDWAMAYWSPQGVVFVRRASVPAAWLKGREFKTFRPDDLRAAEILVQEGLVPREELAGEVERFLRLNPELPNAQEVRRWLEGVRPRRPSR